MMCRFILQDIVFVQVDGKRRFGSMRPKKLKTFYEQFPANEHYVNNLSYFNFRRVCYVNQFPSFQTLKIKGFFKNSHRAGISGIFTNPPWGSSPTLSSFVTERMMLRSDA